jgi:signal peptidase I
VTILPPEDAIALSGPDHAGSARGARETPAATTRSRQAPDYRLRGLDLGPQIVAEAPPRSVRKHPGRRRRRRRLIMATVLAIVAASAGLFLRASVLEPFSVPSASMVPTLQVGDRILLAKSGFLSEGVKTGQIIVFRQPTAFSCSAVGGRSQDLVKRVIGLPGQTIWSVGPTIYVNGRIFKEPAGWYNPPFGQLGPAQIIPTRIPMGSYFVMGDNRTDTCDSRAFGPVSGSLIVGQVVATVLRHGHPHVHFF